MRPDNVPRAADSRARTVVVPIATTRRAVFARRAMHAVGVVADALSGRDAGLELVDLVVRAVDEVGKS